MPSNKDYLLPFCPVIKLTKSPSSISRLLWHIKFSSRTFLIIPAWRHLGRRIEFGKALDSAINGEKRLPQSVIEAKIEE